MTDHSKLAGISMSDVRAELHARAKSAAKSAPLDAGAATPLTSVPTGELVDKLRNEEKVIYGVDDRKDFFEFKSDPKVRELANSVAALFSDTDVVDNGDGTSTLRTRTLGQAQRLCREERFFDQPIGAFCSGFLVGRSHRDGRSLRQRRKCHDDTLRLRFSNGGRNNSRDAHPEQGHLPRKACRRPRRAGRRARLGSDPAGSARDWPHYSQGSADGSDWRYRASLRDRASIRPACQVCRRRQR